MDLRNTRCWPHAPLPPSTTTFHPIIGRSQPQRASRISIEPADGATGSNMTGADQLTRIWIMNLHTKLHTYG